MSHGASVIAHSFNVPILTYIGLLIPVGCHSRSTECCEYVQILNTLSFQIYVEMSSSNAASDASSADWLTMSPLANDLLEETQESPASPAAVEPGESSGVQAVDPDSRRKEGPAAAYSKKPQSPLANDLMDDTQEYPASPAAVEPGEPSGVQAVDPAASPTKPQSPLANDLMEETQEYHASPAAVEPGEPSGVQAVDQDSKRKEGRAAASPTKPQSPLANDLMKETQEYHASPAAIEPGEPSGIYKRQHVDQAEDESPKKQKSQLR